MIEIIASNSQRFPAGTSCGIKTTFMGKPEYIFAMIKMFKHEHIQFKALGVEVLDEESSKSFLGSAGVGLVGAAILGPIGLLAGVFAGGNKQTAVFGLTFKHLDESEEIKLVVKCSNKTEIKCLKEHSFISRIA